MKKTVFIIDELYQSNFWGKPECNSNLIPIGSLRFAKVWGKPYNNILSSPSAVLSIWIVKQNLLIAAKRVTLKRVQQRPLRGKRIPFKKYSALLVLFDIYL